MFLKNQNGLNEPPAQETIELAYSLNKKAAFFSGQKSEYYVLQKWARQDSNL
jgi:hypothetical protein